MKLSVVIVARNEEKNIARCIESVLKYTATVGSVEVLLVDSASTDRTVEIASRYSINIISLKGEWPLSPAAGRFSGVNNVSGEYVLIIDGDMELLPGWIEKALMFMKTRPQVASIVGRHYNVWGTPDGIHRDAGGAMSRRSEILSLSFIFGSSLFRRSFLLKVGNFQPFLRAEEEAEISYRLLREGYELYFLPEDAINHYSIPQNTFSETMRRVHKNLWAGMGDMFSWCLSNGYYSIVWKRFPVVFFFSGVMFLVLLGLLSAFYTKDGRWAMGVVLLLCLFVSTMCIKKGNIYQGLLSVVNIACMTWNIWLGLTRKIPALEEYPRDVVWIKKDSR